MKRFKSDCWALILGGSSGFGLAAAKKLASEGMNIFIVHRDRKGAMERIEKEFSAIASYGTKVETMNLNALDPNDRQKALTKLAHTMGDQGKLRVLLHSIAYGNLRPLVASSAADEEQELLRKLSLKLNLDPSVLAGSLEELLAEGVDEVHLLKKVEYPKTRLEHEDLEQTIYSMGTSLLDWVQDIFDRKLFAPDSRVIGLTSEGNEVAWKGYAAVSAAKAALEAVSRSIAVEYAPYGIRSNILQPGVTETQALRLIPGSEKMLAGARLRNPFRRSTTPEDVANVIALLCTDEAAWINGTIIRVDGGERISSC